jgi:hypothetical protein
MTQHTPLTPNQKALRVNLDPTTYGSFAEIGAGQETARTFFRAGAASGTIAKTISAYDMSFSDNLYGPSSSGRYVSEERLLKMLKKEAGDLTSVLKEKIEPNTRFFVFANTVTTINFTKDREGHGWLGVRFQLTPKGEANEVILHVRMLENDSLQQQHTLGILGTNLIYACFNYYESPNTFLKSLFDSLDRSQLEITMIRMCGPDLDYVDNRLLGVQLVKNGMARAILFDSKGQLQQPADLLYKKNLMLFRGGFRPITYVGIDIIKTSYAIFKRDEDHNKQNTITVCEMTINNLLDNGDFDERDFLARVDILNGIGQNVMVSDYRYFYKLANYLSQFKIKNFRLVIGFPTFKKIFRKEYYSELRGGILEAFGKLFTDNMKIYVYPELDQETNQIRTSKDLNLPEDLELIYQYLISNKKIIDLNKANKSKMHSYNVDILELIKNKDPQWEELVSMFVKDQIKKNNLFGYEA